MANWHGTKRMRVIHSWPWYWRLWPWWGGRMYRIMTGVTSDVGVPSTYLVDIHVRKKVPLLLHRGVQMCPFMTVPSWRMVILSGDCGDNTKVFLAWQGVFIVRFPHSRHNKSLFFVFQIVKHYSDQTVYKTDNHPRYRLCGRCNLSGRPCLQNHCLLICTCLTSSHQTRILKGVKSCQSRPNRRHHHQCHELEVWRSYLNQRSTLAIHDNMYVFQSVCSS